jgi:biofilm PGA synthesis N-glycosyltransferase PgaC
MHGWKIVFWISCLIFLYNYAGYAILVYFVNRLTKGKRHPTAPPAHDPGSSPNVAFIVAAFNEEDCIGQKITNSLEQVYPAGKMKFYFITDGSTDRTMEIILKYPSIQLLHQPERRGKSAALNRAVQAVDEEFLVISDANTLLNPDATANIVRHYQDHRIGGVAGEKKVLPVLPVTGPNASLAAAIPAAPSSTAYPQPPTDLPAAAGPPAPAAPATSPDEPGSGEGLYWKYESTLKKLDSDFYSVVGAAGELFSLRKSLYEPLPHNVILDDFVLSLRAAQKGFRIKYEPDAYAMELPSFSMKDEQKRKIRIAAGGFQAIGMLLPLLAFWRYPRLSFLYVSHRVLRWTLSPLCLILALISNALLATGSAPIYIALLGAQILFYGMAALGALMPSFQQRFKPAKLAGYFVFMNVSVILGFFRFLRGKQAATWDKARRAQTATAE